MGVTHLNCSTLRSYKKKAHRLSLLKYNFQLRVIQAFIKQNNFTAKPGDTIIVCTLENIATIFLIIYCNLAGLPC